MLVEWLKYLTVSCPRHLRKMGYLSELIGLEARYKRCGWAWAGHLENSRLTILEAAELCQQRHRAVVLGSGLLYDVPLEDLSARFDTVALVDILHMPQARRRAQPLANVELVELDITDVIQAVYDGGLPSPSAAPLPLEGADLVVSASVVSQLYHLPKEYLANTGADAAKIDAFAKALVARHFEALAAFSGVACLICETAREIHDGDGSVDTEDPLCGVPVPFEGKEWMWNIAPPPEMNRRYGQRLRMVGAINA